MAQVYVHFNMELKVNAWIIVHKNVTKWKHGKVYQKKS
jgi:hypothetical protein